MTITGDIYDNKTGEVLPGATITIVDPVDGSQQGYAIANGAGHFSITDPNLAGGRMFKLKVTNVGYTPALVDPSIFLEDGALGLDQGAQVLQTAVVTAQAKPKVSPLLLAGGGGLILLMLASKKKKGQSVGAIELDWTKIALVGGVAVGGYFLVLKPILTKLGILGPGVIDQKATEKAVDDSIAKAKADAAAGHGTTAGTQQAQTNSDADITGWANDIYLSAQLDPVNQSQIVYDVVNANSLTDLLLLIKAFGFKPYAASKLSWCYTTGFGCDKYDLPSFLKIVLDGQHLANINMYLSEQGIPYNF